MDVRRALTVLTVAVLAVRLWRRYRRRRGDGGMRILPIHMGS